MDLNVLANYKAEVSKELDELLNWWISYTVDKENGGFYGQIDNQNIHQAKAAKGLVLNTRILYTFSSAYALNNNAAHLVIAERAFEYIIAHFADSQYGGFYWSLNEKGEMLDGKKQVYGQAFAIYAFAEYYKITKNETALTQAKNTFALLEKHSFDPENLGYIEAHTREWGTIADLRLSDKDQNEEKSMNTHLHVVEAYANLYKVWPSSQLKKAVQQLLSNFDRHIIDQQTKHLQLFFSATWEVKSSLLSFGHDIEAAWLLQEAAEFIEDEVATERFKVLALELSDAAARGLASNGGLWYEYDPAGDHWIKEFHWWPQAEAMVGFFNAWQISRDDKYLQHSLKSWSFIQQHLKDVNNGEWFWGVNNQYELLANEDKAGFWKCPYHNGRACIELIKRLGIYT